MAKLPTLKEKFGIPDPKRGSVYIYCPHVTLEVIKEPKKKPRYEHHPCKFRTRRIRKYMRHWRRMHYGYIAPELPATPTRRRRSAAA